MKFKPNRKPQNNKGTRKSAFIFSINSSAAIHPAQAPLNHPELKIINFLNLRKIRLYGHCSNGLHFRKIEAEKSRSENFPNSPRGGLNRYQSESPLNETDKNNFKNSPILPLLPYIFNRLPEMAKFRKSPIHIFALMINLNGHSKLKIHSLINNRCMILLIYGYSPINQNHRHKPPTNKKA